MIGVIVFPAEPEKGYKYKKTPRKVLDLSDEEVMIFSRGNSATSEYFHHPSDLDKKSDKELIEIAQKYIPLRKMKNPRKSGGGYVSEDKKWFIRVIHNDEEWWKRLRY